MDSRIGPGLTLTTIGVLLDVVGNVLEGDLDVWLSVAGAVLALAGVIITWRNRGSRGPDSS